MTHFVSIKHLTQAGLIAGLFIFFSCSGGDKSSKEQIQHETPPSISGENTLSLIKLTNSEKEELNIQTVKVASEEQTYRLNVPGVVFPAPNHVSIISTPIDGRISKILIHEGEKVTKGEELFYIESLEFGNMVSEYLQAVAEKKFQTSRLKRLEQLVEQTISSKSELDRAQSDYQRASTTVIAAFSKLKAIGVPDHEIDALLTNESIDPTLKIHSPISGILDQHEVELGQSVNALEMLGRILDIKKVLIRGYVSPDDARLIEKDDQVTVSRRSNDQPELFAKIASVNPGLDENNRSVVINIPVNTKEGWPKPGENVRLEITTSSVNNVIAIPMEALSYDGNDPIVFVKKDELTFEKRRIQTIEFRDKLVVVEKGLQPDEEVAITQVFSLKALSRYDKIAEE